MPTILSVGGVVRFDAAFVEQMLKKLVARRPAGPSFCLLVRPPAGSTKAEEAVFADVAAGVVERVARDAPVRLAIASNELESTLQGRLSDDDFVRRIEVEITPPGALAELVTALRPESSEAPVAGGRDLGGEEVERKYAAVGKDAMLDEQGRRVKGRPQSFKIKVAAQPAFNRAVVTGAPRKGGDSHDFARDNLLRALAPLGRFASEQQAESFRVVMGMASVREAGAWRELGRLGD